MKVRTMKSLLVALLGLFVATAALAQSYTIRSGDTITVEVLEDPSLNRTLLVLPDGTVTFPFAGSVNAGGRTPAEVEAAIRAGIASNFASEPNVFVTVQSTQPAVPRSSGSFAPATIDVYMMGEIAAPGPKQLERGTTVLQALAATGGFTKFAATKRILLRRTDPRTGKQQVARINYKAIADGAAIGRDYVLADGDVIIVPERRLFE